MEETDGALQDVALELSFLAALVAVSGSLFTSAVLGWSPCRLCLYQRVFMYPLVPLIGAAILVGKRWLTVVSFLFAVVGAPISLYHHLVVRFDPTQGCGFALPCSMQYQLNLSYFTLRPMYLPLLSFIAFAVIAVLLWRYEIR